MGPDGNLWFTWAAQRSADDLDAVLSSVGRITPAGVITEFPALARSGVAPRRYHTRQRRQPLAHARRGNAIVRISVTGTITSFPIANESSSPVDITKGRRGVMWFTEDSAIGRFRVRRDGTFIEQRRPVHHNGPELAATHVARRGCVRRCP